MAGRLDNILNKDRTYSTSFGIQPTEQSVTVPAQDVPRGPTERQRPATATPGASRPSRAKPRAKKATDRQCRAVFLRLTIPEAMVKRARATGFDADDVFRKARQRIAGNPLEAEFYPHTKDASPGSVSCRICLTVPEDTLQAIATKVDPLGVKGTAYLLRGQAEKRLYEALQALLDELEPRPAPPATPEG